MKLTIEEITPAKAKRMLELNTSNRNIRMSKVHEYANEMAAGRWMETGQGLIFFEDNTLGDGQHRLMGIIESGCTVRMAVARGVAKEAMAGIDVGAKRSIADYMHLHHGTKNSNVVCAAAKSIYSLCFSYQNHTIGAGLMKAAIDHYGDELLGTSYTLSKMPHAKKAWIVGSIAFAQKSFPEIEGFARIVGTGEDARRGNPALTFRNWLISGTSHHLQKSYKAGAYEAIFNCMNAYLNNSSLSAIKRGPSGINVFRSKQRRFIESVRDEIKRLRPGK